MRPRTMLIAGATLLLTVAVVMLVPRSDEAELSRETTRAIEPRGLAKSSHRAPITQPKSEAEPVAKEAEMPGKERDVILTEIEQASVTYNATALPLIEPYLLHPDSEVRLAAMNGMVVLGEAAAGPLLRKAAEEAPSPKEAVALIEAADFVEMPSGTFVPKDRTSGGLRKPVEGKTGERTRPRLTPSAKPREGSAPAVD